MSQAFIPIQTRRETGRVGLNEVIYIEKNLQKIIIHTYSREIALYGKMDCIKEYLDDRFLMCHRSYIFNMDKIVHMADQALYLETNKNVHLGRESFRVARRAFDRHLKDLREKREKF